MSVKGEGGPLFLQHTHALAQDAVSRSAFLSNIHAEATVGELYFLGMDVEMARAWMDAVQVDDKLLGHLSAQQLAATLTVRLLQHSPTRTDRLEALYDRSNNTCDPAEDRSYVTLTPAQVNVMIPSITHVPNVRCCRRHKLDC